MNQEEFNKHLEYLEKLRKQEIKYWQKKKRIEENMGRSSGFRHFIHYLQKIIFEFKYPAPLILGGPGSGHNTSLGVKPEDSGGTQLKKESKATCLRDKEKICNQCHECDVEVLNPSY